MTSRFTQSRRLTSPISIQNATSVGHTIANPIWRNEGEATIPRAKSRPLLLSGCVSYEKAWKTLTTQKDQLELCYNNDKKLFLSLRIWYSTDLLFNLSQGRPNHISTKNTPPIFCPMWKWEKIVFKKEHKTQQTAKSKHLNEETRSTFKKKRSKEKTTLRLAFCKNLREPCRKRERRSALDGASICFGTESSLAVFSSLEITVREKRRLLPD